MLRVVSGAVSSFYWAIFYIQPPVQGHHDDPRVIKSRLTRVSVATLLTLGFTPLIASRLFGGSYTENFALLGLNLKIGPSLKSLGLTTALYVGPILYNGIEWPEMQSWTDWRNFFFGPLTEELVYRSALIALYKRTNATETRIIWETPLYFGLAHMHHAVINYREGTWTAAQATVSALAHFAMTTAFGAYSAKLFISQGTVWPSVAVHILCNILGPPNVHGPKLYQASLVAGLTMFYFGLKRFF